MELITKINKKANKQGNQLGYDKIVQSCVLQCVATGTLLAFSSLCEAIQNITRSVSSLLSSSCHNIPGALRFLTLLSYQHSQRGTFTCIKPTGWMALRKPHQEFLSLPHDVEDRNATLYIMLDMFILQELIWNLLSLHVLFALVETSIFV